MSEAQHRQRSEANLQYGMKRLQHSHIATIDPQQVQRLNELRQLSSSHPGRDEVLKELAVRAVMIVELGSNNCTKNLNAFELVEGHFRAGLATL